MIQSIQRAIDILNLFKNSRNPLGLTEMADALGLAKTTLHTIIKTLVANGFLVQEPSTRKYQLGFTLYELGSIQAGNLEINQRTFKPLQSLANETGFLCRVGIMDSGTVFVTMTVQPQGNESLTRQVGPRIPAYCTALGKAILAHLPEKDRLAYLDEIELLAYTPNTITSQQELLKELAQVRDQGYSISKREILMHQAGIGVPVFRVGGQVAGAISMRLTPEDLNSETINRVVNKLQATGHEISLEMGYQPLGVRAGTSR